MIQSVEVCIIGSGISGLKAAQTLLQKLRFNADDILVLEAQNRVGGRLHTDKTLLKIGNSYDLGASWFHDCLSNVVFQHFFNGNDPDIFDWTIDGYFDDKPAPVFTDKGPLNLTRSKREIIQEDIEKFIEMYFFEHLSQDEDISLKEAVDLYLKKYSKILTGPELDIARVSMRYLELWHGISWDKLSARYAVLDHQGRNLFNKKGNQVLISWLLKLVPENRIQTNSPVVKIERDIRGSPSNKRIAVHTKNNGLVYCNYLLVTVPQSILALEPSHPYGITWEPPLPPAMKTAIQKVSFGALGKVVFEFESPWWDINQDRFEILSNPLLEKDLPRPHDKLEKLPAPFSYPALAVNHAAMYKEKKAGALIMLTQSPLTEYLEENPEKSWEYFGPMLEQIANAPVEAPINTIVTGWTLNPYIRGSYTAAFPKDDPVEYFAALSGEIPNVGLSDTTIRFSGEHTATEGEGCIHGAWMTGEKEAHWIIQHSGKQAKL